MKETVQEEVLDDFVAAIRHAGEMARQAHGATGHTLKTDGTYVTEMDLKVESYLRGFIHKRLPDHRVLGEEGGQTGPPESRWTWIIDPIDGTTNFTVGLPVWAISVGLLEGRSPHWGCVYIPVLDKLFVATRGKGATQNGRTIHPLKRLGLEREDLFAITSDGVKRYDYRMPQKIRAMGSAAAQAAFVACGHYVGYFLDVWYVWDIAAALLIAREAGVVVTDLNGKPFESFGHLGPEPGSPLLFAVPGIHAQLLPLIVPKRIG